MSIRHDETKPVFRVIATFLTQKIVDLEEEILIIQTLVPVFCTMV
jgi:hypothetical protein